MIDPERKHLCKVSCETEMESMKKLEVYDLMLTPKNLKPISTTWVFCDKKNHTGKTVRYKSRWVLKGVMQTHGIDYDLTHSPVSKMTTLRFLISLAAQLDLIFHKMDATAVFHNAIL